MEGHCYEGEEGEEVGEEEDGEEEEEVVGPTRCTLCI
jgi:hypothetical protein